MKENNNYQVYALVDEEGRIIEVNSSAFLADVEEWIKIDEGNGDSYHHGQGNYFPDGNRDDRGIPLYKWDGTQVVRRTQEEIDADYVEPEPVPSETEILRTQVNELQAQLDALLGVE